MILADDHAMVRQGFSEMLSADAGMVVIGEAENGREAVALAKRTRPDVVILDVEMPVMGAQAALKKMLDLSPPPKVVIVTVFADRRLVQELLALGASAYLSKGASMRTLLDTVRSVARGGDEENVIVSVPRETLHRTEEDDPGGGLTRREREVLLLVARGLGNGQVGEDLHLSKTTVKRHLSNIYEKLGVHSRGEAVGKAISEGWISSWDISRTTD
ncbi:MAG: response regulator transcription factor [Rubrobacteraceae bacterium]|nr:response regulator transcription factor [Rubrobacteraceae bacterium]